MKLENFISSCRRPVVVASRNGKVSVPCDQCPDCQNRRALRYTKLCKIEASARKYTYFFTLSYSEPCVPKVLLKQTFSKTLQHYVINAFDFTTRPLKSGKWKPVSDYGTRLAYYSVGFDDDNFSKFYDKTTIESKSGFNIYKYGKVLRYLRKKDVQDFFKRLRFHLSKYTDASISYYCAGEYGPRTFRPHFHVILFFDNSAIPPVLEECINKSWKLGSAYDISAARNGKHCAQYVASYCNSFSRLPRYLSCKSFKPFSLHSRYFGISLNKELRDYCYEDVEKATNQFDVQTSYGIQHYTPTTEMQSLLFPRCYNHGNQNPINLYKMYSCFSELSKRYATTNCSELTKYLLINHNDYYNRTLLELLELSENPPRPIGKFIRLQDESYYSALYSDLDAEPNDEDINIFTRIYTQINLSKHFYSFCCEKKSPKEVFQLIQQFYTLAPLVKLRQFYESLMEYNKQTGSEDYTLFYNVNESSDHIYNYFECYTTSPYIQSINHFKDIKYEHNIKKKLLNDANLIFT